MSTFLLPLVKGVHAEGRQCIQDPSQIPQYTSLLLWIALLLLMKGVEETKKVLTKVLKVVPWFCKVSQEGKGVSILTKIKEKIRGYVSGLILYFGRSTIHEFVQEAEISHTKPIRKQEESRGWFKICLTQFLLFTTGPSRVRSEHIGNQLILGSTAMNSLLASKNLRGLGLSERRWMLSKEAASMNDHINYQNLNFRAGKSSPNKLGKKANSYQRGCNSAEYCCQGKKGKKN